MSELNYIYWQGDSHLIGYLEEFPDYWTQGEDLADLEAHLLDLHKELNSGEIPYVKRAMVA